MRKVKEETEMERFYSAEKNVQYLLALLKENHIKNVIVSPGTANFTFVGSVQHDPYFNLISCVDERSAAYMACGIAATTQEPVVISCTGATASRNYMPGLTEAFYRKLPVLAVTAMRNIAQIGQNMDQVIDRSVQPKDIVKKSVYLPIPASPDDEWGNIVKINDAILELRRAGGGPVHINLSTEYNLDFSVKELPKVRVIRRYTTQDKLPEITADSVRIFVGTHLKWDDCLTKAVDEFCEKYNGVVICDQVSNYTGKYGVYANIIHQQKNAAAPSADLLIHLGGVSQSTVGNNGVAWRVNPDGEVRDTFKTLECVFEMEEHEFFEAYCARRAERTETSLFDTYHSRYHGAMTELKTVEKTMPFSNVWMAYQLHNKLPHNSELYLGILNSLRSWNYFETEKSVIGFSNTGGYGIDGGVSSAIGAAIVNPEKLCFCVTGDLAFFYDMNSLGNRHIGNNLRILIVNNGIGEEFKHNMTVITRAGFGEDANSYMAAEGHFGNKSRNLVRHFAEDLGFEYLQANNKEEFKDNIEHFVSPSNYSKPIVFEVFTDYQDETDALEILQTMIKTASGTTKQIAKKILGEKGVQFVKKVIKP